MTPILNAQTLDTKAIDKIFEAWNQPNVPGASLGIFVDGKIAYSTGYGLANLESNIPNEANTVFRIGSTSKQFTAACISLLAVREELNLDDTLKSIFPEFPDYASEITIRHLFHHTSGIRDYLQLAYLKGLGDDDFYTDKDIMNWLTNQSELNFQPGAEYLYSNSGYWLLGQIVERVSGINMAEFAHKEIFGPLRMTNTHFHNDNSREVNNRALGYVPIDEANFRISMTNLEMIGDGGILTTINDIKKWDDEFYQRNVLSDEFWNLMTDFGHLNNGDDLDYAGGLIIGNYRGQKTISHGGAFVGFRAEFIRFPDQKTSIAIFTNRGDAAPWDMAFQVADIVLKVELENIETVESSIPVNAEVDEFSLDQISGDYEIEPGINLSFTANGESLDVIQTWNNVNYTIIKSEGNTFKMTDNSDFTFSFSNLDNNKTQTLTIQRAGIPTVANRTIIFDASSIDLSQFLGSYFSKELEITYHFELNNGSLQLRLGNQSSTIDTHFIDKSTISTQFGQARFVHESNNIVGFELESGRVQNLKFTKL